MGSDPATPAGGHQVGAPPASEPTTRVRAALVAGYRGDTELARSLLDDPEPEVRCAALGALHRCGELRDGDLVGSLVDPDPGVRCRALELAARRAGRSGAGWGEELTLGAQVRLALEDRDPLVAESACWATGEAGDPTAVPALCRLARGHADPRVREGAVAAIGAIVADAEGAVDDPGALQAVLEAAGDKPGVRRRAAVALSAFAGPEATQALEQLAADRDWQVRQVAEAILRQ